MTLRPIAERTSQASLRGADAGDFASVALPLMPSVVRVAQALTGDESDADDLVQETFLRAYRHWQTFQPGSDCRSWLSTICRNAFYENRRRERRSTPMDDHELDSLASGRSHNTARAAGVDDLFVRIDLGPALAGARSIDRMRLISGLLGVPGSLPQAARSARMSCIVGSHG